MRGDGFGAVRKAQGEFVFNTGMVGYPESITDPSYAGQILIQTYPLIGNYSVNRDHLESDRPKIEGYVVRELCVQPSHWSSELGLDDWLAENGVPGIAGLDTRFLTQKISVLKIDLTDYTAIVDLAAEAKHDWRSLIAEDEEWQKKKKKKKK